MEKSKYLFVIFSLITCFCNNISKTYKLEAYQEDVSWAIDYLDLPEAWEFVTGSSDVIVGVLDSGIEGEHTALSNNIFSGDHYQYSSGYESSVEVPIDDYGHGSSVAGIIGGQSSRVDSVCSKVSLRSFQIATESVKTAKDFIKAIENVEKLNIPIVNLSFTYNDYDNDITSEYNKISSYSGLLICSAGNDGLNLDSSSLNTIEDRVYPSKFYLNNTISVGAIDSLGERWVDPIRNEESNYGINTVDIYAPGENINTVDIGNSYRQDFGGTSSAAAFVSGVAALLKSLNPSLTTSQLKSSILNSANIISITLPDGSLQSVKSLNAYNAVKYVLENYPANECSIEEYSNVTFSNYVNTNNTVANDDYSMIKINVEYDYNYEIHLSSLSPIEFTLYDSNFNEVEVDYQYTNNNWTIDIEDNYFDIGVYYLKTNYVNGGSGTINVNICDPHEHDFCIDSIITEATNDYHYGKCACGTYGYEEHEFGAPYSYISVLQHNTTCVECEYVKAMPHAVINGSTNCIQCGGYANVGINPYSINSNEVVYITENGSYILPNGIIVLNEKDVVSYLKGTLQFYIRENNFETE